MVRQQQHGDDELIKFLVEGFNSIWNDVVAKSIYNSKK